MMDPVLSIIIPTRDRPGTLVRTLRALARQSLSSGAFEVVVVDDGSEASTREAVEIERGASGGSVEYLRQPAAGPAAARNAGIRAARAPLLLFLGDDIVPREVCSSSMPAGITGSRIEPSPCSATSPGPPS